MRNGDRDRLPQATHVETEDGWRLVDHIGSDHVTVFVDFQAGTTARVDLNNIGEIRCIGEIPGIDTPDTPPWTSLLP